MLLVYFGTSKRKNLFMKYNVISTSDIILVSYVKIYSATDISVVLFCAEVYLCVIACSVCAFVSHSTFEVANRF
jgi:hypothetical protein